MDANRLGLLPVLRWAWAPRGQRPVIRQQRRYQWLSVYGFVRPQTGQTWWCLLPTVSRAADQTALAAFAKDGGIDAQHRVALVVDGAAWHTSAWLVLPAGIDLLFLPPASPALAPAERLWPLVDAPVLNHSVPDLSAREAVRVKRRRQLMARHQHRRLRSLSRSHWWPAAPRPSRK